jgi:hypothetical protein
MSKLFDKITELTFGIRFKRSFRIADKSGEIIDDVLTSKQSPFSSKTFPQIQTSKLEKVIFNDQTGDYLRINTDDLILAFNVDHNFENKFEWLKLNVAKYFQEQLFRKFNIQNIRRIGIVFAHELPKSNKLRDSIPALTNNLVDIPNETSLSFSKKTPVSEALMKKNVNDYKNSIYILQETDDSFKANFDFQHYYEPIIEDLRDCRLDEVFDSAKNGLEMSFHPWLKNYVKETE